MTKEEMKEWIDKASYKELLAKIRFELVGSKWFAGEMGTYFMERYMYVREQTPHIEQVAASIEVGW